ncbi:hypothetical protein [Streptomyces nitrosporeus]|uniref:hypothetical protein n=1 Tax=Streptomyces nitrosporeus TaxID=28894 RepID=UPI003328AA4F
MKSLIASLRGARTAVTALLVALATTAALGTLAAPAHAAAPICEQYGTTVVQGTHPGTFTEPQEFTLNGESCAVS